MRHIAQEGLRRIACAELRAAFGQHNAGAGLKLENVQTAVQLTSLRTLAALCSPQTDLSTPSSWSASSMLVSRQKQQPPCACQVRPLFGLPGQSDDTNKDYKERRLIGYSPAQLYGVVADVQHYVEFVPWCQRSKVMRCENDTFLEAELEVGFKLFVERYTSQVYLKPGKQVISRVFDSTLFDHLDSEWDFQVGPSPSCTWLTFSVDFGFKSPLYRHIAAVFFEEVVQRMMSAFEGRCQQLFGPSSLQVSPPVGLLHCELHKVTLSLACRKSPARQPSRPSSRSQPGLEGSSAGNGCPSRGRSLSGDASVSLICPALAHCRKEFHLCRQAARSSTGSSA